MKNFYRTISLTSILILTASFPAKAEMVSYIDDKGEMHYVNTNFSKVPEQYLDQIKQKTDTPETTEEQTNPSSGQGQGARIPLTGNSTRRTPPPIEVLINAQCLDCKKLELLLKAHKIPYLAYDVDKTSHGKTLYQQMDGRALPITIIGTRTIYGIDILSITSAYHEDRANDMTDNRPLNPKPPEQIAPKHEQAPQAEAETEREEQ